MRLTRIATCLGWLIFITLGLGNQAAGFTLTPCPFYPSFLLEADVAGIPAAGYDALTQYNARMVNSDGNNSATSDWSATITGVTDSWGAGGKTSAYTQRIDVDMQAQLTSVSAHLGKMATLNSYFEFQPEAVGTSTPYPVEIDVSWAGDVSGAYASIALYKIEGFRITAVMQMSSVNLLSSQGTQTFQAFLPQSSGSFDYDIFFYLTDKQDWTGPGSFSSSLSVEVTLKATEAGLADPNPPPVPLPASLVLLGSGLAALGARQANVSLKKRVRRLIGPS